MSTAAGTGENFDFGRVLSQIGGLIGRNFVPFFVLSLLFAGIPTLVIFFIQLSLMPDPTAGYAAGANFNATAVFGMIALALVATLPMYVLQAALTRAAIDDLSGKGVSISAALQSGLRFLFPLLGLAILATLGVAAGLIVLIVPGIILAICWAVASPALIVEKTGIIGALQRSLALTRNHRWALFGLMLLYGVAYLIVSFVIGLLITSSMGGFGGTGGYARPGVVAGVIQALFSSLAVMITTVGVSAIYFELRRIKDGVGVNELASVFD